MSTAAVALLTDFGYEDAYVGVMKAVMLAVDPALTFIDLTHNVPPQNLTSAGYLAAAAWPWLPAGTVLLAVVDPGVGSARRELILEEGGKALVAPDNGLVTLLADRFPGARMHRADAAYLELLASRKPAGSTTFDGRDLFSPIAAELARGNRTVIDPEVIEPVGIEDFVVAPLSGSRLRCPVLHVDHFGNCITGISLDLPAVRDFLAGGPLRSVLINPAAGRSGDRLPFRESFSAVEVGHPLAYWGSTGFLELALRNGSYAARSSLSAGSIIEAELNG